MTTSKQPTMFELEPPMVPAIIPGDPDGLVLASALANPLNVTVLTWRPGNVPFSEKLVLRWAQQGTDQYLTILEYAVPVDAIFPLELFIPVESFIEGRRLLGYEVRTWDDNFLISPETLITLDRTPPWGNAYPAALQLAIDEITDAYLDQHNGEVIATLPDYPDRKPGDSSFFYWIRELPQNPDDLVPMLGPIDLEQGMSFGITRAMLKEVGNGDCYGLYVLRDKAGNVSRLSYYVGAMVALT